MSMAQRLNASTCALRKGHVATSMDVEDWCGNTITSRYPTKNYSHEAGNRLKVFIPDAGNTVVATLTTTISLDIRLKSLGKVSSHAGVLCCSVVGPGLTGIN